MIRYNKDIMSELKKIGLSSYRIRNEKLLSEKVMTEIRQKKVTMSTLNKLCQLLNCQPGDILEYIPDPAADETSNDTPHNPI